MLSYSRVKRNVPPQRIFLFLFKLVFGFMPLRHTFIYHLSGVTIIACMVSLSNLSTPSYSFAMVWSVCAL